MKRVLILTILLLLSASSAFADYTAHQIVGNDGETIVVEFTGAGEQPKRRPFAVRPTTTFVEFRTWVGRQIADLNSAVLVSKLAAVQVGQSVTPIAPTPVPPPTAEEIAGDAWAKKVRQLQVITQSGVVPTGAFATAVNALRQQVIDDYNAANGATRAAMADSL